MRGVEVVDSAPPAPLRVPGGEVVQRSRACYVREDRGEARQPVRSRESNQEMTTFDTYLQSVRNSYELLLKRPKPPFRVDDGDKAPAAPGVYVLYEQDRPLYMSADQETSEIA